MALSPCLPDYMVRALEARTEQHSSFSSEVTKKIAGPYYKGQQVPGTALYLQEEEECLSEKDDLKEIPLVVISFQRLQWRAWKQETG